MSDHGRNLRPGSGQMPAMHSGDLARVKEVMSRYISPILVDAVLSRALAVRNLDPLAVSNADVPGIVESSMIGLRLFVDQAKLPELMVELADVLGR